MPRRKTSTSGHSPLNRARLEDRPEAFLSHSLKCRLERAKASAETMNTLLAALKVVLIGVEQGMILSEAYRFHINGNAR